MDKVTEDLEQLQAIADRCETEEDVFREVARLSPEQKMRLVFATAENQFTEDVRQAALVTADICDEYGLLNDMQSGTFRRDHCLGIMTYVAGAYLLSTEDNTRQELQCMNERTEFASRIADATNTTANALLNLLAKLVQLDSAYTAILTGRKMDVHFINEEGDHKVYTEQEREAKAEQAAQRNADLENRQEKIKTAVEEVYWGQRPRDLDLDESSRQLCIPLWVGVS